MQAVAIVSSADLRRIYGGFAAYLTVFCKMELSDLDRIDRLFLGKNRDFIGPTPRNPQWNLCEILVPPSSPGRRGFRKHDTFYLV